MPDPSKPEPVITVQRKITPLGNRCWFYCGGKPVQMSEAIALQGAKQGTVRIKTIGDRR